MTFGGLKMMSSWNNGLILDSCLFQARVITMGTINELTTILYMLLILTEVYLMNDLFVDVER